MIYEPGNAAKQWILEKLDQRFGQSPARILDLASSLLIEESVPVSTKVLPVSLL